MMKKYLIIIKVRAPPNDKVHKNMKGALFNKGPWVGHNFQVG